MKQMVLVADMSWMMPTFRYVRNDTGNLQTLKKSKQSLLSLPYLGFLEKDDETYVATRKLLLSARNPYYAAGKNISGVG